MACIAVVTAGSFARAANRPGVGRSAVSRGAQKIGRQRAARLFLRITRTTTLIREGERFYADCPRGVERIAQAMDEMQRLACAAPGYARAHGLPQSVDELSRYAPDDSGHYLCRPSRALKLQCLDEFDADAVRHRHRRHWRQAGNRVSPFAGLRGVRSQTRDGGAASLRESFHIDQSRE